MLIFELFSLKINQKFHNIFCPKALVLDLNSGEKRNKAGYSYRTAQPLILAVFLPWGGSAGAGRIRPASLQI